MFIQFYIKNLHISLTNLLILINIYKPIKIYFYRLIYILFFNEKSGILPLGQIKFFNFKRTHYFYTILFLFSKTYIKTHKNCI